jgi:hypothetical protein
MVATLLGAVGITSAGVPKKDNYGVRVYRRDGALVVDGKDCGMLMCGPEGYAVSFENFTTGHSSDSLPSFAFQAKNCTSFTEIERDKNERAVRES